MAIRSEYIDPTDTRIKQIFCQGCFCQVWVEKGSDCDSYSRCTKCVDHIMFKLGKGLIIQ